ncbi:MAG: hypothetical protein KIT33_13455 [Candidatus Kapabacteria bacterium]|nr:hypothetical protein [Ignavibacteriota bacterium]MCW5885971.1 hypothetical protein [Candidatus Kapabacteria bacterium]
MKISYLSFVVSLMLLSCSKDYPYDEKDFNIYGGIGRTNAYEQFGSFPLQLITDEPLVSEDSSGVVQTPLRLKSPYFALATSNGNILKINNSTFEKSFNLGEKIIPAAGMAVDKNSNIYIIASDDKLYSINNDFELNWIKELPVKSSRALSYSDLLATVDGLYIGTNAGDIIKFDFDGNIDWHYKSSLAVNKTFAADSLGNIYFPMTNNTFGETDSLLCLDKSGKEKWSHGLENVRILTSTAFKNSRVFVGGSVDKDDERYGKLFCFDLSGNLIWASETTLPVRNISLDYDGNSYITSISSGVGEIQTGTLSFDFDGKERWRIYHGAAAVSPLMISDKYLAMSVITGAGAAVFYQRKSDGLFILNHSLANYPPMYLSPMVYDDATIRLYGSHKLSQIKLTQTSLNKLIP